MGTADLELAEEGPSGRAEVDHPTGAAEAGDRPDPPPPFQRLGRGEDVSPAMRALARQEDGSGLLLPPRPGSGRRTGPPAAPRGDLCHQVTQEFHDLGEHAVPRVASLEVETSHQAA